MKVIRIDDEETKLTKRQKQKIAILKLTENGKYIENIGIKDNEFFLLTEGDDDEQYLAYMFTTTDADISTVAVLYKLRAKAYEIHEMIEALKELESARKKSN
jgi:acetolactate synthase small subunit